MRSLIQSPVIEHILLGVDGSASSARARDYAAYLAINQQARVTVVHAFMESPAASNEPGQESMDALLHHAHSLVFDVVESLRTAGVEHVDQIVREGPAVDVVLQAAEQSKVDMIVIGARGTSERDGVIQGSVSAAVTQRAKCPVLVVK